VLLAPLLLTLGFSASFTEAASLLRLIILGETLVAVSTVVSTTLLGLGRTWEWASLSIVPALARAAIYFTLSGAAPRTRLGGSYAAGGLLAVALAFVAYRRHAPRRR
jgi:O-antigen/teichoic acid export membrane protein